MTPQYSSTPFCKMMSNLPSFQGMKPKLAQTHILYKKGAKGESKHASRVSLCTPWFASGVRIKLTFATRSNHEQATEISAPSSAAMMRAGHFKVEGPPSSCLGATKWRKPPLGGMHCHNALSKSSNTCQASRGTPSLAKPSRGTPSLCGCHKPCGDSTHSCRCVSRAWLLPDTSKAMPAALRCCGATVCLDKRASEGFDGRRTKIDVPK